MKKINLLEEKKNLNIGDYGEYLCDYNNGYVSDIFMEIADNNTSIYYSQMLKWLQEDSRNVDFIERAVQEGLVDVSNFDFYNCISSGQYLQIIEDLNANEEEAKLNYTLNYLINNEGIEELDENIYDELVSNISMCDTIDGIIDEIHEALEVEEDA